MKRLQWMALWDELREEIKNGNTSLGKNQLLEKMDAIERKAIRALEIENESA